MKDDFLTALINIVNETKGLSFDITINVQGTTISGNLISYETYLRELSDNFSKANGDEKVGKVFSDQFSRLAEVVATSPLSEGTENETEKPDSNYVHLRNARIVHINGDFITNTVWRGKIESVDGFFLGSFNRD